MAGEPSRVRVRRHATATALLTALSYTVLTYLLTFHRALQHESPLLGVLPHVIAAVNLAGVVSLQLGYRAIRRGDVRSHRNFMGLSFVLITTFLTLYVTRLMLGGTEVYRGPQVIRDFVYLPVLTVHLTLSILSVPLVLFNVLTGLTLPYGSIGRTPHPKVGKIAYLCWSLSLALGIVVYVLLRWT
jgi:putative membrane protein